MSETVNRDAGWHVARVFGPREVKVLTGPKSSRLWVHILLFGATFITTTIAGALWAGVNPMEDFGLLHKGLPYSVTLLIILGAHEFGHYFASRSWRVKASLPYFLPGPPFPIGTFGAVIRTKSRIPHRRALLDIGVAGPLAGFAVAFVASVVGLRLSEVVTVGSTAEGRFILGDSLLFSSLVQVIWGKLPPGQDVLLHPVAFAGWLGFFVTTLNLLPIGQLDGGHVVFALWGGKQKNISASVVVAAISLGLLGVVAPLPWLLFCLFAVVVTGIAHPPVYDPYVQLDGRRKAIGYLSLLVFVLCFTPVPISMALR